MEAMNIRIGPLSFDHADYDADGDVLYLHVGAPQAGEGEETREGHVLRFAPGTQQIIAVNNAFRNNTTANWHNYTASVGDIALSGTPFTSAGTDFSLNATAGAGAACRAAGIPGTLPGAGTVYADVGALQHSAGGGGTTVYVIAPNITNLIQEGVV